MFDKGKKINYNAIANNFNSMNGGVDNGSTKGENIKTKKAYTFGKLEVDRSKSFGVPTMPRVESKPQSMS